MALNPLVGSSPNNLRGAKWIQDPFIPLNDASQ